jgi:hypothetical protein
VRDFPLPGIRTANDGREGGVAGGGVDGVIAIAGPAGVTWIRSPTGAAIAWVPELGVAPMRGLVLDRPFGGHGCPAASTAVRSRSHRARYSFADAQVSHRSGQERLIRQGFAPPRHVP